MGRMQGKTVIVSGAAAGIGLEIARLLVREEARYSVKLQKSTVRSIC